MARPQASPAHTAVLVVLATARLTRLITTDHLLDAPRAGVQDWAEARHATATGCPVTACGRPADEWHHPLAYLLSCRWCASAWVAAGLVAALAVTGRRPPHPAMLVAAASMLTGLAAGLEPDEHPHPDDPHPEHAET